MKQNFFRAFLGIIIISLFLPSFVALPITPQASFYYPFWVILVLFFYPKVALNTGFLASFSFVVLHVIYIIYNFYQNENYTLFYFFWPLAFSFSVIEYFQVSKDFEGLKLLTRLALILILITSFTSSVALTFFPGAARDMAGYLSESKQGELGDFYMLLGIGNYYFYHNIAICSTLIILLIQRNNEFGVKKSHLILALFVVFFAVIRGAFSSAFGIFFIGVIFAFILPRIRTILFYIITIASFYIAFSSIGPLIAPGINVLADAVDSEDISPRLRNVAANLDGSDKLLADDELRYTQSYEEQLKMSLEAFQEHPLTGAGRQGGHHFWADFLAKFGIIGTIPWLFILFYLFRSRLRWLKGRMKVVVFHGIGTLIFIGFFKPIGLEEMFSFIAIFLPAFLIYFQSREIKTKSNKLNLKPSGRNIHFFKIISVPIT